MRVMIIGGTGLIGRATISYLRQRGAEAVVVSRRRPLNLASDVQWVECDIQNSGNTKKVIAEAAPDAILHLAALLQTACEHDPDLAVRINVEGTLNVLNAAKEAGVQRVVFGSSIAVYGQTSQIMRETGWLYNATGIYGVTKLLGEALGERFQAKFGMTFVALRYSGVYGKEEDDEREQSPGMSFVRKQILKSALGNDIDIFGASGEESIHLTHVSDAAAATWLALTHPSPAHTIYNVAGPESNFLTLQELYEAVRALAPQAGRIHWKGKGKSAGRVDITRIVDDLGYRPAIQVNEGLREALSV